MAIDAMKILGSLLSSGTLSRGRGSDILGSVLGSVFGGEQPRGQTGGGGIGDILGGMLGGGSSSGGGGLDDLLGGLLGGGSSSQGGGDLADLIGAAMKQLGGSVPGGVDLARFRPDIEPEQANEQALILVRAMINAAKADGRVDQEEQQHILEGFGDEVSRDELDFLKEEMARPLDAEGFARSVPRGMEQQVYLMSLTAIDLDTNPEAQYLHLLTQGLGLDADTVNAIHDRLGAPRLYR
ncbi:DUF533 domain-containing protein [Thiolapillus sp.]